MVQAKRIFDTWAGHLGTRLGLATLLSASGANVFAHSGHQTPSGVSPLNHLHLASAGVVTPEWFAIGVLALAGTLAIAVVRHRRKTPRGVANPRGLNIRRASLYPSHLHARRWWQIVSAD